MKIVIYQITLFCTIILSCSTPVEFEIAEKQLALDSYDASIKNLDIGLQKDPNNRYYKILKKVVQRRAAQYYYEKALLFLEKNQLLKAETFLEKIIKKYDPDHIGAYQKLAKIRKTKTNIKNTLDIAKKNMNEGLWDESYLLLKRITVFQNEFKKIRGLYEKSRKGSFDLHFNKGKGNFFRGDYKQALDEFNIALSRVPTDISGLKWQAKSNNYKISKEITLQADELANNGKFKEAYNKYNEALEIVPAFQFALSKKQQTKQIWIVSLYKKATAEYAKKEWVNAVDSFNKINELEKGYKDVSDYLLQSKENLSKQLLKKARDLLWQSKFSKLGSAYFLLEKAHKLSPTLPNVSQLLTTCKKLVDLKYTRHISITLEMEGEVQKDIQNKLLNLLTYNKFRYYTFSIESAQTIKENLTKKTSNILKGTGLDPENFPWKIYQLKINVPDIKVYKKEIYTKKIKSSYFAGLEKTLDTEWVQYKNDLATKKRELQKAFDDYAGLLNKREIVYVRMRKYKNQKQSLSKKLDDYRNLKIDMEKWESKLKNYKLNSWMIANQSSNDLYVSITASKKELRNVAGSYAKFFDETQRLDSKLSILRSKINNLENEIEKYQRYLDYSSKLVLKKKIVPYFLEDAKQTLTGNAKFFVKLVDQNGKLRRELGHEVNIRLTSQKISGAHIMDVEGKYNVKPYLPLNESIKQEIIEKLSRGIYRKLLLFLYETPVNIDSK